VAPRYADLRALALLVCLGAAQRDGRALAADLHVGDVERHQHRAAERPGEAQQQGAVAGAGRRLGIGKGGQQQLQVLGHEGGLADLGGADGAADAAPGRADAGVGRGAVEQRGLHGRGSLACQ
jgi:hypothetical protein